MGKRKSLAPCAEPGCPVLTRETRCPKHAPEPWGGRTWSSTGDRDPAYQRMRRRVLREEPRCRLCGTAPSTNCNHIVPKAFGGGSERGNLCGLCTPCHQEVTRIQRLEGRRRAYLDRGSSTTISEEPWEELLERLRGEGG